MVRICFSVQLDPSRLDDYRARHAAVWPELLREIAAAGRRNYSIFLGGDGLLVGYYETDDDEAGAASLAAGPASARWEAEMKPFFRDVAGRVDQSARQLELVFNLEEQQARL